MNTLQPLDVLIVGQGLAGSLLAWELMQRGQRVLVVDDGHRSSSTRMAAGLLNPVTGAQLVKIRQADTFLPKANDSYAALERTLGATLFHRKPMLRVFATEKQRAAWTKRRQDPVYAGYLDAPLAAGAAPCAVDDPHGSGIQHHTGYLDTVSLLDGMRNWLQERDAYRSAGFDWRAVSLSGDEACWQQWRARRVIGCEGYRGKDHPWFPWLPLRPNKGQILTLESDADLPDWIINKGHWLLPVDRRRARFGATYEREALEAGPTDAARVQLLAAADRLTQGRRHWRVVRQEAGLRPGTVDRMPLVGLHPQHPQLGMFNGFGSKGVMMMPYYAAVFAAVLGGQGEVPTDVDLRRFWTDARD